MPALLGYWKLRGLGSSIRLLLEYTETDYTEKLYEFGPAPDFDASQWTKEKFTLGMDLPNLPYYFDGPNKVTQSNAILRYIARKHDLVGKTDEEVIKVDMIENQAMDFRMAWVKFVYDHGKNFETNKVTYVKETLPATLKLFNGFLGSNKWFAGEHLGQSIRLLLEFTGTDYTEKRYEVGPAPDFDRSQWTNEKYSLGMELPNLPYYFDGPHKVTQSHAILRYIARKHDMCGSTEEDLIKVDMLENQALDCRMAWVKLVYSPAGNFEANKETYIKETLPSSFKLLNSFIGNNKWFIGDKITFVDFLFYELLDINETLAPSCLDDYENLKQFKARFESLKQIKNYMSSDKYIKTKICGPTAAFGTK